MTFAYFMWLATDFWEFLLDEEVLPLGAVLSALPVDLSIGKLLIFSTIFGLEDELMTIAAGLRYATVK